MLRYELVQGPIESTLIKQAKASGRPIPDAILAAPEIEMGLQLYYEAFKELSQFRPSGWGIERLPWALVHDWCDRLELDEDQRSAMLYHVAAMDRVFIEVVGKSDGNAVRNGSSAQKESRSYSRRSKQDQT